MFASSASASSDFMALYKLFYLLTYIAIPALITHQLTTITSYFIYVPPLMEINLKISNLNINDCIPETKS